MKSASPKSVTNSLFVAVEHQIGRLQIAVDHAHAVRVIHRLGDGQHPASGQRHNQRRAASADPPRERSAFQKSHGVVKVVVPLSRFPRMLQI